MNFNFLNNTHAGGAQLQPISWDFLTGTLPFTAKFCPYPIQFFSLAKRDIIDFDIPIGRLIGLMLLIVLLSFEDYSSTLQIE
jgi:hypothetical protein